MPPDGDTPTLAERHMLAEWLAAVTETFKRRTAVGATMPACRTSAVA